MDANTLIKRIRFTSNAFPQFKDKDVTKYLKLNESLVVLESSSEEDDFNFNVHKGYFSSSDEDQNDDKKVVVPQDEFSINFRNLVRDKTIQGLKISHKQKLSILNATPQLKSSAKSSESSTPKDN